MALSCITISSSSSPDGKSLCIASFQWHRQHCQIWIRHQVIKQLSPNSLAQNHNYYPRLTASFSVRMSDEHTYKFDVKMTCSGCSGAITRVLEKAKNDGTSGVSSYDVSLENQEVLVTGTIPYDDLLEKIKKTGKEVRSGVTVS